jgi:asparagine synthase (glutamine-hydrolysing)
MCGIVAYYGVDSHRVDLERMMRFIAHRGPDGQGRHVDDRFGLGHQRLSIIDLSGGGQPLYNEDRTVVLVANNEIYNFRALRRELESLGHRFATASDSEVIIHAYEQWGESCFRRFNGMFAMVLVDIARRRCLIARDHLGIKPLHYASYRGGYVFASEAKPILSLEGFRRELDPTAFHMFMNLRYVPTDDTLFSGIKRLPPGCYAVLEQTGGLKINRYYSLEEQHRPGPWKCREEALEALAETFGQAVERHLESDVPVATYLSGGIDSSLVTAYAAKRVKGIQSFCMTFGEPSDEDQDASRVAAHLGTRHQNLFVGQAPLTMLPEVIWHVEEPKVNCLQGYLLASQVSRQVKVVLSGLGGDELFLGYTNHDILFPMARLSRWLRLAPPRRWHGLLSRAQAWVGDPALDIFFRGGDLLGSLFSPLMFYAILRNCFEHSPHLSRQLLGQGYQAPPATCYQALSQGYRQDSRDILGRLSLMEMGTKMINDFLLTEDRVSMGHGLEVRVPFLDRELVDLVLTMPTRWKYRPGQKKLLLKELAQPELPPANLAKPKWGFSFNPYHQFKKDLRFLAERELTRERVAELGLFNYAWIRQVLDHAPTPRMRWHYFNLWVMVGFSHWHRMFVEDLATGRPATMKGPW